MTTKIYQINGRTRGGYRVDVKLELCHAHASEWARHPDIMMAIFSDEEEQDECEACQGEMEGHYEQQ